MNFEVTHPAGSIFRMETDLGGQDARVPRGAPRRAREEIPTGQMHIVAPGTKAEFRTTGLFPAREAQIDFPEIQDTANRLVDDLLDRLRTRVERG